MKHVFSVFGIIALVVTAQVASGSVIVPSANTSTAGTTDNRFPFLVAAGMRYQQVYASSQFSGPVTIDEIDFRNGIFVDEAFTSTISNIQISLSTTSTSVDGLSSTFASNTGADNTLVYSGSLTLSSTNAAGPGNTHVFDIAIHLQTPFTYNPANGNLLLDVDNLSGANAAINLDFFDAVNTAGDPVSRVWGTEGQPNATTGTVDTIGLITRFDTVAAVPEPGTILFAGLGMAGLLAWRKRTTATRG